MKVEIEIPAPPEGLVYDGYRKALQNEYWFDCGFWNMCESYTEYMYPVAVKANPLWTPSPELVAVVSSGWIAMDSSGTWFWYSDKPVLTQHTWEGASMNSMAWIRPSVLPLPNTIPWDKCCFRIGGDE
jgi:hypothetical protein